MTEHCLPTEDCYDHTCVNDEGDEVRYTLVYLRKPAWGAQRQVARWCLGEGEQVHTTEDIGRQVEDQWVAYAPEQDISIQPPGGRTLINVETYLDSGQPASMGPRTIPVLDFQVTLWAQGEWTWTLDGLGDDTAGPPVRRTFHDPGSSYNEQDPDVFHVYETPGTRQIQLTTTWHGQFRIGDHGPYDIETAATQTSGPVQLDVLESRNALSDQGR